MTITTSTTSSTLSSSSANYKLEYIQENSTFFSEIKKSFRGEIQSIYGDQERSIRKIKEWEDRRCEGLLDGGRLVAFIVYKKDLQTSYEKEGIKKGFELKNLVILDPEAPQANQYRQLLLSRIAKLAEKALAKSIYTLVAPAEESLISLLESKGYKKLEKLKDKNVKGGLVNLMALSLSEKIDDSSRKRAREEDDKVDQPDSKRQEIERSDEKIDDGSRKRPRQEDERVDQPDSKRQEIARSNLHQNSLSNPKEGAFFQHPSHDRRIQSNIYTKAAEEIIGRGTSFFQHPSHDRGSQFSAYSKAAEEAGRGRGLVSQLGHDRRTQSESASSRMPFYSEQHKRHELTLRNQYIHQIQSGQKTIEGRINQGAPARYKVGDNVRFFYQQNPNDDALCTITKIVRYSSFKEMLEKEGFENCLADVRNLPQAISVYDNIPGYSQRAAQYGVLAIHVKFNGTSRG